MEGKAWRKLSQSHLMLCGSQLSTQNQTKKKHTALGLLQKSSPRDTGGEAILVEVLVHTHRQRELDLRIVELLHMWSAALGCLHLLDADDLDRVGASTMTGAHVTVLESETES